MFYFINFLEKEKDKLRRSENIARKVFLLSCFFAPIFFLISLSINILDNGIILTTTLFLIIVIACSITALPMGILKIFEKRSEFINSLYYSIIFFNENRGKVLYYQRIISFGYEKVAKLFLREMMRAAIKDDSNFSGKQFNIYTVRDGLIPEDFEEIANWAFARECYFTENLIERQNDVKKYLPKFKKIYKRKIKNGTCPTIPKILDNRR